MSGAPRRLRDIGVLAGFVVLCLGVSAVGGAVTATSVNGWYQALTKPGFNPPDWVFGPVWTLLYVAMAVAAWRVWRSGRGRGEARLRGDARLGLTLFGVQLVLNLGWTVLFFGFRLIGAAMVELVVLFAAIAATAWVFRRVDTLAALLFLPYLAWVGFAGILNFAIWRLN